MENSQLGAYDMVFALSEQKINSQFDFLMNRLKLIPSDWCLAFSAETGKSADYTPALYKEVLDSESDFRRLDARLTAAKDLKDEIARATGKPDVAKQLREKRLVVLEEIEELREKTDRVKGLIVMRARISSPSISIQPNSPLAVSLKIDFKEGELLYHSGTKLNKASLAGCSYAFSVPIGIEQVNKTEMQFGQDDADGAVGQSSLDDFRIESLFLDFTRANISQFDAKQSVLPPELKDSSSPLQIALVNYFTGISGADSGNPYLLGYTLSKRKPGPKALFQPMAMRYSTSFGQKEGEGSAFNFMMSLNGNTRNDAESRGGLPKELLSHRVDKSTTVSGVFGIRYSEFRARYLSLVHDTVAAALNEEFKKNFPGVYQRMNSAGKRTNYRFEKHDFWLDVVLELAEECSSDNSIEIQYRLSGKGNVHFEKSALIGTTGIDQPFSTEGRFNLNGSVGAKGNISIKLTTGTDGRVAVSLDPIPTPPSFGFDEDADRRSSVWNTMWEAVSSFFNGAFISELLNGRMIRTDFDFAGLNHIAIDFADLDAKVILPGTDKLFYKNIRAPFGTDDNGTVLLDVTYKS